MKNVLPAILILTFTSCGMFKTLTSNTVIAPGQAFKLGDNSHGTFSVKLKNVSKNELTIYEAPISGGKHSFVVVKPDQTVKVSVDENTALIIENNSSDTASVDLLVKGDLGLSMGYKAK
jgi:hypothetical protein